MLRGSRLGGKPLQVGLEPADERRQFVGGRPAADRQTEAMRDFIGWRDASFGKHPLGKAVGRLDERRLVQQRQCLQRRVGPRPLHRAGLAVGGIEDQHRGRPCRPLPDCVHRPPVAAGAGIGFVSPEVAVLARLVPDAIRHPGPHAWSAERRHEQARGSQRRIADGLAWQPDPVRPSQQPVGRILGELLGRHGRLLPVGAARQHHLDEGLHVPGLGRLPVHGRHRARFHELRRQPVEQFRVARILCLAAEVFARLHQARAEEPFPHPVHPHPCRERVVPRDDPLRQRQPIGLRALRQPRQKRRQRGLDLVAPFVVLAAAEHEGIPRRALLHHHGAGQRIAERINAFFGGVAGHLGPADRTIDIRAVKLRDLGLLLRGPLFAVDGETSLHAIGQLQARDAEQARLVRRKRQAKPADRMAIEGLLSQADHQPRILRHRYGLVGKDGEVPRLPLVGQMTIDRPALPLFALQYTRCSPAVLLVVGLGPLEFHGDHLGVARRLDLSLQLRHHDVAVACAAEAAATGQTGVGQHLQPQTAKLPGRHERFEFIGVTRRELAFHEP